MIIIIANKTADAINVGSAINNVAANNAPNINPKVNANKKAKKATTLLEQQQNIVLWLVSFSFII